MKNIKGISLGVLLLMTMLFVSACGTTNNNNGRGTTGTSGTTTTTTKAAEGTTDRDLVDDLETDVSNGAKKVTDGLNDLVDETTAK